jgi:Glycosyl transferase family 2
MDDVARIEPRPPDRERDRPELSVILGTDGLEPARETIAHLRAQTARDRVEVVIVTPRGSLDGGADRELDGFHSFRVIDLDPRASVAAARAAGVSAARAPVVAMAETHCFPEPGWAEALIAAHRGPWAAVGPEIANENPGRMSSWANLYVDYAPWVAPAPRGPADDLPGHNSSYKRARLLDYGDELGRLMESESIIHWDLRSRGHRLYVETEAKVRHRNVTRPVAALLEHFHNGRCFGGLRSHDWSVARRVLYAAASPLIPALRLARIIRCMRTRGRGHLLPGALPMMLASLVVHAAGELTGYAAGAGDAARRMVPYELHRNRYVAGAG